MNDDSDNYYELLGVAPGASARELKEAYRDLAKVWHPDRFSHDPRLQHKAQEKLKQINEAYKHLTSGRAGRHTSPPSSPPRKSYAPPSATVRRRDRRWLFIPTAVVCCAVFFAALNTLAPPGARRVSTPAQPTAQEKSPPNVDGQQPDGAASLPAAQPTRGKRQTARLTPLEAESNAPPDTVPSTQPLRPMPTVTVNIDAATGLLATKDCPLVSRMTYPAGGEPRQYCNAQHRKRAAVQAKP